MTPAERFMVVKAQLEECRRLAEAAHQRGDAAGWRTWTDQAHRVSDRLNELTETVPQPQGVEP